MNLLPSFLPPKFTGLEHDADKRRRILRSLLPKGGICPSPASKVETLKSPERMIHETAIDKSVHLFEGSLSWEPPNKKLKINQSDETERGNASNCEPASTEKIMDNNTEKSTANRPKYLNNKVDHYNFEKEHKGIGFEGIDIVCRNAGATFCFQSYIFCFQFYIFSIRYQYQIRIEKM